jgi:hypothetical protein
LKGTDVPKKERKDRTNGTGANGEELGTRNVGGVKLVVEEENGDATMVDAHHGEQKMAVKTEEAPAQDETVIVPAVAQETKTEQEEEKPETEVEVSVTADLPGFR